jgi:hypothetical protein
MAHVVGQRFGGVGVIGAQHTGASRSARLGTAGVHGPVLPAAGDVEAAGLHREPRTGVGTGCRALPAGVETR